jgi:hypothetical protein
VTRPPAQHDFRGGSLTILKWEGLRRAGEFDVSYLNFDSDEERAA